MDEIYIVPWLNNKNMGSCSSKKKDELLIFLGSNSQHSIHKALMNFMIKLEIFSSSALHLNIPDLKELPFFNKDLVLENSTFLGYKERDSS